MTIQEAYNFFENLKNKTTNSSEIKVCNNFLTLLANLQARTFSLNDMESIQTELTSYSLTPKSRNNQKQLNKILNDFKAYLKENHDLISAGYYSNVGISTGIAFGVVLGVVFGERFEKSLGLAIGISIGMLIGLLIGRHMDAKVKRENRTL